MIQPLTNTIYYVVRVSHLFRTRSELRLGSFLDRGTYSYSPSSRNGSRLLAQCIVERNITEPIKIRAQNAISAALMIHSLISDRMDLLLYVYMPIRSLYALTHAPYIGSDCSA